MCQGLFACLLQWQFCLAYSVNIMAPKSPSCPCFVISSKGTDLFSTRGGQGTFATHTGLEHLKGRKKLRVSVISFFEFIWKFLISIKGSEEKAHWNSIQELPAYTEFFKDVWLDLLKMTKTMNCVAPGFLILLTLLSLHLCLAFLTTLHLCGPVSACRASLNRGWERGWEVWSSCQVSGLLIH